MINYFMILIIIIIIITIIIYDAYYITRILPSTTDIDISKLTYTKNNIPRIIFRTTRSHIINKRMYDLCHRKWLNLNPVYQMFWFDDHASENFMKEFGEREYRAWKKLKPGAFKADLWRVCILYKYGGIYVDSYSTPYISIDSLIDKIEVTSKHTFISALDAKGVHNGFMIVSQEHPFLKQTIADILENVETNNYCDDPLAVTGPVCLYRSILKVLNKPKLFKGLNTDGTLSCYLLNFLNCFFRGPFQYIREKKCFILRKKYSTLHYLYQKVYCVKTTYNNMWINKDIYNL